MPLDLVTTAFWLTGAVVWCVIAILIFWLFMELLIAVVASLSWHRWMHRAAIARGKSVRWIYLPVSFLGMTFALYGHRNNGSTVYRNNRGVWRGIGDYEVHKPSEYTDKEVS